MAPPHSAIPCHATQTGACSTAGSETAPAWRPDMHPLLDDGGRDGEDRRQVVRDQLPRVASVAAGEDLAGVRADIDAARVERVAGHAVAQHAQRDAGAGRQAVSERLPALAAVARAIDGEVVAEVVPVLGFHDGKDRVGVLAINRDGEAELGRQIVLDVRPFVAAVEGLVDAAVVLLIQHVGIGRVLQHAMQALAEVGIYVRLEAGARALVGEGPRLAAVLGAITARRRDAHPHPFGIRVVRHDGVQAHATSTRIPVLARGMAHQAGVQLPRLAAVAALPQAGGVHADVDSAGLARPTRLDYPDVLELVTTLFWELDAALRLAPGLAEV